MKIDLIFPVFRFSAWYPEFHLLKGEEMAQELSEAIVVRIDFVFNCCANLPPIKTSIFLQHFLKKITVETSFKRF